MHLPGNIWSVCSIHPHTVCGRQVRIMKEWDPSGKQGPRQPMPDLVTVLQPKEEEPISDKPMIGAPVCMI